MIITLAIALGKDFEHIRNNYDVDDFAEFILCNHYDNFIQYKLSNLK